MTRPLLATILLAALAAHRAHATPPADLDAAAQSIDAKELAARIAHIASDAFEGRAPGSPGEDKTVAYLVEQFRSFGLKPGNPDGRYIQDVPLVGVRAASTQGKIDVAGTSITLRFPDNWVAVTRRDEPKVEVRDSDVVFVGYGVVAPEYGWDDYKDVDVRGKTIVMLVNDPAVPDPADPAKLDPALFKGNAMTYYGRWTYKYEIATAKGAAAAIIVHETKPAAYPFEVVVGSWGRENFDIDTPGQYADRVQVEAWVTEALARNLFTKAGLDFDRLKAAALRRDFRPVALNAKASFAIETTKRRVASRNVVARLEGSDPKLRDECVVYTAHWDHLGRDPAKAGDQIYNGAADNASGTCALLDIAQAFGKLKTPPKRSVVFLSVTAEEQGLLGAKYYASKPLYPLEKTLANINMDVINLWGRTEDVVIVGSGQSTLDDALAAAAHRCGRVVAPDPEPEKGGFYRSDHFEFAKVGVPALDPKSGARYIGKPADFGKRKRDDYTKNDYHKPSDEVKLDWNLDGAVDDLRLFFEVGDAIADGDVWPSWRPDSEFRARRETMLKAKTPAAR